MSAALAASWAPRARAENGAVHTYTWTRALDLVTDRYPALLAGAGDGSWTDAGEDPNAPFGLAGSFYLFGGISPDGTYSRDLWVGRIDKDDPLEGSMVGLNGGPNEWAAPDPETRRVIWRRLPLAPPDGPVPDAEPLPTVDWAALGIAPPRPEPPPPEFPPRAPPGLARAALAASADGKRIWMIGGVGAGGPNADLWAYNLVRKYWELWGPPEGDTFAPLPDMAATFRDDRMWAYGGWRDGGPAGGLYELDLTTRAVRRLDADGAFGPGPRSGASLQLDPQGRTLLLFGGYAPSGWTNDLWRFDLRTKRWEAIAAPCISGGCPPDGPAGLLVEPWSDRVALIPAHPGANRQPYWQLEKGRWTSGAEAAGSASFADCDRDEIADPGFGDACRTTAAWWADVGRRVCGTFTAGLECDAAPAAPAAVERIAQIRPGRVAVDDAHTVSAAARRRLRVYDASVPGRIVRTADLRLHGKAREVLLHEGMLYVATSHGLEGWSRLDPRRPLRLWSLRIPGGVDDVVASEATVVAVGPDGFRVYDTRLRDAPRLVATHTLVRSWPRRWHLNERRPPRDVVRALIPGRRAAAFDGTLLVIGDRYDLIAMEVGANGEVTRACVPAAATAKIKGIRLRGETVYTAFRGDAGGEVWRVGDGVLSLAGSHALESWVDRAAFADRITVRPGRWGIEVARAAE
jgi:hypothetical protein